MKKIISLTVVIYLFQGCGVNSDGSSRTTYSSCSIVSSEALLATDRANDVSQCWDGVDYVEKSLALDWCRIRASSYMAKYIIGHAYSVEVKSTNCP